MSKLVPKLRFKEFSGEWEEKEVGELFQVTRGEVLSMLLVNDKSSTDKPYPVYSSQTKKNGLAGYYSEYLFEDAITWTTDGANAGDVNYREGKFYCTNVCGVLINRNGYANQFMAELLNTVTRKHVSYVGNPKLMNGVMAKISIPIPKLDEQQKIDNTLSSLDSLIEATSKKVEALKKHKKGLMQKLFPKEGKKEPEIRFKEFRGEWEEKKLGDIVDIYNGSTPKTSKQEYWNGEINWITPAEMGQHKYISSSIRKITKKGLENSNTKLLPINSVILSCRAPIGYVAINKKEMSFNQGCKGIIPNKINHEFLYYFLKKQKVELENLGSGNTFKEISTNNLKSLKTVIPTPEEQQKISDTLSSLDSLIESTSQKIEALKKHKKSLMQQMFVSGEG